MLINEKEIEIKGKKFFISKLPATVGREILLKYPSSNIPKIGDYEVSKDVMLKLMSFVGVSHGEGILELKTEELVNNHITNAEQLILLEKEMFKYNFDFFTNGDASAFFQGLEKVVTQKGIGILTTLLDKLSPAEKQRSKS